MIRTGNWAVDTSVVGFNPRAYFMRFGTLSPMGVDVSAPAPTSDGLWKYVLRHCWSGVNVEASSRPKTPTWFVAPTYTRALAVVGVMNLLPTTKLSRPGF